MFVFVYDCAKIRKLSENPNSLTWNTKNAFMFQNKREGVWLKTRRRFLIMYQRADVFAGHDFLQVAHCIHIEYNDGEFVFFAHAGSGQIHYL